MEVPANHRWSVVNVKLASYLLDALNCTQDIIIIIISCKKSNAHNGSQTFNVASAKGQHGGKEQFNVTILIPRHFSLYDIVGVAKRDTVGMQCMYTIKIFGTETMRRKTWVEEN